MFTTYAPEGIDGAVVYAHLKDIEEFARLVAPAAVTDVREVQSANGTALWPW
jgi:hypothetical protein